MKLAFGLYTHMLNDEDYAFSRQAGATHIVAHLTDYFYKGDGRNDQPVGDINGWGHVRPEPVWSTDYLRSLKRDMARHDLELAALENISPAFWHDVLLDGPNRCEHIENVKRLIRNMGAVGIGILGYNFSLAGVAGRTTGPYARGGAVSVGLEGVSEHLETPIPAGMVWNMIYDQDMAGVLETVSREDLWKRYSDFLNEILPVAEAAGVELAAHPDDPPLPDVRKQPRLIYQHEHYDTLLSLNSSPNNRLEFCLGTLAEMTGGSVYDAVDHFTSLDRVAYIHFRNIRGKVPDYKESFIDDGDVDMPRVMRILKKNNFQGLIIPDHAPRMSCAAPWHSGMAYAMGYIKALMQSV